MSTNKLTPSEVKNALAPCLLNNSDRGADNLNNSPLAYAKASTNPKPKQFCQQALADLPLSDQILFQYFGQGAVIKPEYRLIHRAFEQYAQASPENIAVEHLGSQISYGQLNVKAELLAKKLMTMGVKPGDNVGLFLTRSIAMIVGIMAVLKLGAAYVPQHLGIAKNQQLLHIIAVANIDVILTLSELEYLLPQAHRCQVQLADELLTIPATTTTTTTSSAFNHLQLPALEGQNQKDQLLSFVLFTSGTTGKPNGVCVSHHNLCNIILTTPGNLAIERGQKVAQVLSIAFDMAAWEIFSALTQGATLCIRGAKVTDINPDIDTIIATPSILATLDPRHFKHLKTVAVAGEPCPKPLADLWSGYCRFYNACGPTETTIVNTMQDYQPCHKPLTIGSPTPNNTVYVLDEHEKPCCIGETGMMWAGGACVTLGYLGNDKLTGQRYKRDPFRGDGTLMFRTGDLGRWNANGELEHLGRSDDQIKIKGFRVELDSVSSCLENVKGCRQAVTLKRDDSSLIAFVCPANISPSSLKENAEKYLPYYAVPKDIITLSELPVTPRGKIDKRALLATYLENKELEVQKLEGKQLEAEQLENKQSQNNLTSCPEVSYE